MLEPAPDRRRAPGPPAVDLPADFGQQLRARDPHALARFYEIFFDRVYGYVRRMLGEEHLAEDVTQDVFMHIQRSIHTYDPARALSPWVFTIATNKVRDFWRSRRHKEARLESALDDDGPGFDPPSKARGPLPELENVELGSVLSRAIDELPPGLREPLVLRAVEGLDFAEIGERIGRNEVAARKRYSRALEALRSALERYAGAREKRAR